VVIGCGCHGAATSGAGLPLFDRVLLRFFASFPLHSSILKPNFDLKVAEKSKKEQRFV
jgi:hypothetical protein